MNFHKSICILVIAATLAVAAQAEKRSFEGYRLLRLTPKVDEHAAFLVDLQMQPDVDIWNNARGLKTVVDIALSPEAFAKYAKLFDEKALPYEVVNENIQNIIDAQVSSMTRSKRDLDKNGKANIVGKYARYTELINYLDNVATDNSDIVSTKVIGTTHENRQVKTLTIKTSTADRRIWIDCGIHAREWVAPATCIWIIDSLIKEYRNNDPVTKAILDKYEIHVLPLINPDGYEYTHTNQRLWRKNRVPNAGSTCLGVDLCRNYGYKWMTGGASDNPCSDLFAGFSADSELETIAVEDEIMLYNGTWDSFLTFHTYGLWWFTPWGYSAERVPDYDELVEKAEIGAAAFKDVNGLEFDIGSSAELLYVNSGPSDDWAYGHAKIKYTYTLELRPGQSGVDSFYGFMLPENRVPMAGEETYAGVKAFINSLLK